MQLLDLRYASKADPTPSDFCGYAHYLSPEQVSGMATEARAQTGGALYPHCVKRSLMRQVSGQGHGLAVDFWALGTLTYEMITGGANPWLTGDLAKDSEVGIYQRISMHQAGNLKFPDGVDPPQVDPRPKRRSRSYP